MEKKTRHSVRERESMDGEGELKLKTRKEWEDKRGGWVWWGLVLSSDWLLPLPHAEVLRLVAAPELKHTEKAAEEHQHNRSAHSFMRIVLLRTNPLLLWKRLLKFTFIHLRPHNAALIDRSREGFLGFTVSVLYSHVKGGKSRLLKGCLARFGKRIRREFAPGLLLVEVSCEDLLWEYLVGYCCLFEELNWMLCCLCPWRPRGACPKCAQVVERAHFISDQQTFVN